MLSQGESKSTEKPVTLASRTNSKAEYMHPQLN